MTDSSATPAWQATAFDAIASRRSVREFEDKPIADADLDQILEAGRRSPSGQNLQPWDFIVVTDRQQLTELAKVWQNGGHVAKSAATIALIAPAEARHVTQFDLGQAALSLQVAAAGLGIGSGHSAVTNQDLARQVLGFPEDKVCAWLIPLGYPAGRPLAPIRRPNRRPFDEVVHRGRW